jgi:phosphoserine phosphatase RsbU/P
MNESRLPFRRLLNVVVFLIVAASSIQAPGHVPGQASGNGATETLTQSGEVDATKMGEPVSLDDGWRVHSGDDPQWSDADFDDSAWQPIDLDSAKNDQMFASAQGFVWLRVHVRLPANHGPLSFLLDQVGNSYQVFANGQEIGHYGNFRSLYGFLLRSSLVFPLAVSTPSNRVVIAIRLWAPQHRSITIPPPDSMWIGPSSIISSLQVARQSPRVVYQFDDIVVALLGLLIGSGLICLSLADRTHREYAWAGISLALIGLYYAVGVFGALAVAPVRPVESVYIALGYAALAASIEFLFCYVGRRPGIAVRIYQAALLICACFGFFAFYEVVKVATLDTMAGIAVFSYAVLSVVLLIVWYLRGNREAAILLLPVIFFGLALPLDFFSGTLYALGWTQNPDAFIPDLHIGPVHFVFSSIAILLYMLSFVVILGFRFLRTSRQQELAAAELAAAHRVQNRLVPVTFPSLGKFSIEAAYIAAAEVGGDFYQAFPEDNGGLLFFIGDVSGKGLSAAMIGTLIVGALRTIAAQKLSAARSLTVLNQQLQGQTDGGFATCLCARISAAGTMVISNAGHLAPYLNGAEIELANGLPLGITSTADYVEEMVELPKSARLTFVSDGVVEATNAQKELLGFARTQELSILPAAAIAEAAQAHGQTDDITVVTIQC